MCVLCCILIFVLWCLTEIKYYLSINQSISPSIYLSICLSITCFIVLAKNEYMPWVLGFMLTFFAVLYLASLFICLAFVLYTRNHRDVFSLYTTKNTRFTVNGNVPLRNSMCIHFNNKTRGNGWLKFVFLNKPHTETFLAFIFSCLNYKQALHFTVVWHMLTSVGICFMKMCLNVHLYCMLTFLYSPLNSKGY